MVFQSNPKIIVPELALVNVVLLVFFAFRDSSAISNLYLLAIINAFFILYRLNELTPTKLVFGAEILSINFSRFGKQATTLHVPYKEIEATYKDELAGRGIRQKQIRLYQDKNRFAVLEPSFSGWEQNDLEKIAKALTINGIDVATR